MSASDRTVRVLLGDDHRIVREGLKMVLADDRRIQVVGEADTGPGVLDQVAQWQGPQGIDVVLLDIAMPVMDGKAALGAIREIEAATGSPRVPIIAVTANAMSHQIVEYLIWGFDSCVSKPLTMGDVTKAIRALLPRG